MARPLAIQTLGTMHSLGLADLNLLMEDRPGPCVSIHAQTVRFPDQAAQNRIRFKNAVSRVESVLSQGGGSGDAGETASILALLREVEGSDDFFRGMLDGLCVFAAPGFWMIRLVPFEVPDFTVVGKSFHVKPFIRGLQYAQPFRLLCVSSERVALYQGSRYGLEEVELHPDVPRDMGEALGEPSHVAKTKRAIQDPADSDGRDTQLRRYFRRLDEAITRHHAPPDSAVPLMLAALPEYHTHFKESSHNPRLIEPGIRRDPFKDIDPRGLADLAHQALQPVRDAVLAEFKTAYGNARSHDQGSEDLDTVARQAVWGKVDSVAIQRGFRVGGTVDIGTGEVTRKDLQDPAADDLLDDIAEATLRHRGMVMVLNADQMPTKTGVAAIFRK